MYVTTFRKADREIFAKEFVDREEKALANQVFIEKSIPSKAESIDSNAESENEASALNNSSKSERLKTQPSNQAAMPCKTGWLGTYNSNFAKEKLIKILNSQAFISQQYCSIGKILATLVHHQEDKRLQSHYRQFKQFAYYTMLVENKKGLSC